MTDSGCEYGYIFWYNGSEEGVLEEKVLLERQNNMKALPPYDLQEFRIKVSPSKHKIIVFKRTSNQINWKISYKSWFSFGEKEYLEEIYEKGKKIQVVHNTVPYDIWIYTMYGGSDFYFVMENKTKTDICKAKFKLNLTNMHDTDNPTA